MCVANAALCVFLVSYFRCDECLIHVIIEFVKNPLFSVYSILSSMCDERHILFSAGKNAVFCV